MFAAAATRDKATIVAAVDGDSKFLRKLAVKEAVRSHVAPGGKAKRGDAARLLASDEVCALIREALPAVRRALVQRCIRYKRQDVLALVWDFLMEAEGQERCLGWLHALPAEQVVASLSAETAATLKRNSRHLKWGKLWTFHGDSLLAVLRGHLEACNLLQRSSVWQMWSPWLKQKGAQPRDAQILALYREFTPYRIPPSLDPRFQADLQACALTGELLPSDPELQLDVCALPSSVMSRFCELEGGSWQLLWFAMGGEWCAGEAPPPHADMPLTCHHDELFRTLVGSWMQYMASEPLLALCSSVVERTPARPSTLLLPPSLSPHSKVSLASMPRVFRGANLAFHTSSTMRSGSRRALLRSPRRRLRTWRPPSSARGPTRRSTRRARTPPSPSSTSRQPWCCRTPTFELVSRLSQAMPSLGACRGPPPRTQPRPSRACA